MRRQMTTCSPARIVARSPQWELPRYRDGGTADIIETILYADSRSAEFIQEGVECLRGRSLYETLRNVWGFVRYNITYRADRPGHERVKSPGALFASGFGDCKSYSIAIGALLRALGVPYSYRFTAYEPGDFTHVYIVARTSSGPVILDAVHTEFDDEVPYYRRRDIRPKNQGITGIGSIELKISPLAIGLAAFIAYTIFTNDGN